MTILTITSKRSGTGKTFLAKRLAALLAKGGEKVLYVSFNLAEKERGTKDLLGVLKEEITLNQAIIKDPMQGFDLIVANNGESLPVQLSAARLDLLKSDMLLIRNFYDTVILDMPAEYLFFAKAISDAFFVILTPDMRTLEETYPMLVDFQKDRTALIVNRTKNKTEGIRIYDIMKSMLGKKGYVPLQGVIREGKTAAYEDMEEVFEK